MRSSGENGCDSIWIRPESDISRVHVLASVPQSSPALGAKGGSGKPAFTQMTLEEEVLSLKELAPYTLDQLPALFAESVVAVSTKVLGETTGEAFIRCIGDSKLSDPAEVYQKLDSFLLGGAGPIKEAIMEEFRNRVHRLYRLTVQVAVDSAAKHLMPVQAIPPRTVDSVAALT